MSAGHGNTSYNPQSFFLQCLERFDFVYLRQRQALEGPCRRTGDLDGVEIPEMLFDEDGMRGQRLGAANRESQIAGVFNSLKQQQQRRLGQCVDELNELLTAQTWLGRTNRDDPPMTGPMGHGVELSPIDVLDRDCQFRREGDDLLELVDMRAVSDENDVDPPLASLQRGEDGLAALKVLHERGEYRADARK